MKAAYSGILINEASIKELLQLAEDNNILKELNISKKDLTAGGEWEVKLHHLTLRMGDVNDDIYGTEAEIIINAIGSSKEYGVAAFFCKIDKKLHDIGEAFENKRKNTFKPHITILCHSKSEKTSKKYGKPRCSKLIKDVRLINEVKMSGTITRFDRHGRALSLRNQIFR